MSDVLPQPRICTLIDRFPPLVGGVERQAEQLSRQLAERGYDVLVITRRAEAQLPAMELRDGLRILRVGSAGERSHKINIVAIPAFLRALFQHRHDYDLLHVHDMFSLVICAVIVRLLLGKPFIIKVPTRGNVSRMASPNTPVSLYSRLLHSVLLPPPLWKWLLNRASRFIALSDEIAEELAEAGLSAKTVRIPNAVDVQRFVPATVAEKQLLRQQLRLPVDARLIVSHGRISRRKRLDVLIAALAQLPRDVQVVLPGPYDTLQRDLPDELRALITRLGLEGRVHLPGATDAPEEYLCAADIFAMPSEQEGMPNALLEAMGCGLPCCASRIGGVVDVLTDGENGLLSPAGDAAALAANLQMLLDDPAQAQVLGIAARKTMQARYTWDGIMPQYEALYAAVLRESGKPGV